MIIGIDISMLVYAGSGVATYTYELVRHLLMVDRENEYRLFYSSRRKPKRVLEQLEEFKKLGGKVFAYPLPPWFLKLIWNRWQVVPVEWLIGKVDVYHSSDFLRPPLLPGTNGMTTIHDLTWKIYPEYHTPDIVAGHERKLRRTIEGGDTIIVDSQNTRKDLFKFYPVVDKKKVHVIPLGVSERFKPVKDKKVIKKMLAKYQLPTSKPYLLYVGAIEPRKGLKRAVEVFSELIKNDKYKDFMFVIAGRAGWKNEELFGLVESLQLKERVLFPGYVEDEDLPALYSGAELFVYLSEYEGFGLPPLEALACGTKVLVSRNSSLSEFIPENYLCENTLPSLVVKRMKEIMESVYYSIPMFPWKNVATHLLQTLHL